MSLHQILSNIQTKILAGKNYQEVVDDFKTFWYVSDEIYAGRVIGILFENPSFIAKFGKYLTPEERDYIYRLMEDGAQADRLGLI